MFISSVFALLTVAADPNAAAREPMGHAGFCAKIECTDAQRQTAHRIHESLKADLKDEREAMKALRGELRTAMAAPKFDEAKVRSILARMDELQGKMSSERRDAMVDFVETLEPEQRRAFAERLEHRGKRGKADGTHRKGKGKAKGKGTGKNEEKRASKERKHGKRHDSPKAFAKR